MTYRDSSTRVGVSHNERSHRFIWHVKSGASHSARREMIELGDPTNFSSPLKFGSAASDGRISQKIAIKETYKSPKSVPDEKSLIEIGTLY